MSEGRQGVNLACARVRERERSALATPGGRDQAPTDMNVAMGWDPRLGVPRGCTTNGRRLCETLPSDVAP